MLQRNIVFNYFAALAKKLRAEKLTKVLPIILLPLLRELSTTDEQGVEIRRVAKEVLRYYCPLEQYDVAVTEVQRILDIKRAKRKSQKAHMVSVELIFENFMKFVFSAHITKALLDYVWWNISREVFLECLKAENILQFVNLLVFGQYLSNPINPSSKCIFEIYCQVPRGTLKVQFSENLLLKID